MTSLKVPLIASVLALATVACDSDNNPPPNGNAPATPTGLSAVPGDGQIMLTWNANSENDLSHYNIYRGTSGGNLSKVDKAPAGTESYTATGLTNGTTYFLALDAENTDGDRSERTDAVSAMPEAEATFEGLGDLPGGNVSSQARGVSADGAVVVGDSDVANGTEAFRWENGTMTALGQLAGGADVSLAFAASSDGTVVGHAFTSYGTDGFRWENGTMTGLGALFGQNTSSQAWDVSNDGTVIVGWAESQNGYEAFRWQNGQMMGLGDLPGGAFYSEAHGASANGSVIVGYSDSGNGSEAFRWENGAMAALGTLPGGAFPSIANGVSADDSVIVGYAETGSGIEAFRWENGVMAGLGLLPGTTESAAYAVSADGNAIVGSSHSGSGSEAFIWTPDDGMQNLKSVLENVLNLDLSGWTLEGAMGISDDGTVIVGYGENPNGDTEAWRAFLGAPVETSAVTAANLSAH